MGAATSRRSGSSVRAGRHRRHGTGLPGSNVHGGCLGSGVHVGRSGLNVHGCLLGSNVHPSCSGSVTHGRPLGLARVRRLSGFERARGPLGFGRARQSLGFERAWQRAWGRSRGPVGSFVPFRAWVRMCSGGMVPAAGTGAGCRVRACRILCCARRGWLEDFGGCGEASWV